ncbi:MAG: glycosyltransferase family 2 protein [Verrucomicrobiota bacterium]
MRAPSRADFGFASRVGFGNRLGMDWPKQCAAVVPCLNEAAGLGSVVEGVRRYLPAVIVVDDGSSDATAALAEAAGAEVIRHPHTQGKGAALTTGWRRARERGFRWALCLDGDGQHASEDIPNFFQCAADTGATLIIGNRMGNTGAMPFVRRWVNRWLSRRISALAGRELPDTQCGFRLMDLPAWSRLSVEAHHFEIESEVLLAFLAADERVEFVPVAAHYKRQQSKIHPVRDSLRWFRWWRRVRATFRRA